MPGANGVPILRCDPCWRDHKHKPAVGRCSGELNWRLCEEHFLSAGGLGFYPKRYGDDSFLSPQKAAELSITRRKEQTNVTGQDSHVGS